MGAYFIKSMYNSQMTIFLSYVNSAVSYTYDICQFKGDFLLAKNVKTLAQFRLCIAQESCDLQDSYKKRQPLTYREGHNDQSQAIHV